MFRDPAAVHLSPGLPQLLYEDVRLLYLNQNSSGFAPWRQQHQTLAACLIQSDPFATFNPPVPEAILPVTVAINETRGRAPVGIFPEIHNLNFPDINICGFQSIRVESIVDAQCFRSYRVFRGTGRIQLVIQQERYKQNHENSSSDCNGSVVQKVINWNCQSSIVFSGGSAAVVR